MFLLADCSPLHSEADICVASPPRLIRIQVAVLFSLYTNRSFYFFTGTYVLVDLPWVVYQELDFPYLWMTLQLTEVTRFVINNQVPPVAFLPFRKQVNLTPLGGSLRHFKNFFWCCGCIPKVSLFWARDSFLGYIAYYLMVLCGKIHPYFNFLRSECWEFFGSNIFWVSR